VSTAAPKTVPPPCLAIYRPGSWVIHSRSWKLGTDQQLC
jgi:hypothetical protein